MEEPATNASKPREYVDPLMRRKFANEVMVYLSHASAVAGSQNCLAIVRKTIDPLYEW
jgi:hypothetical protein